MIQIFITQQNNIGKQKISIDHDHNGLSGNYDKYQKYEG